MRRLLAALVALRLVLAVASLLTDPDRYRQFEETYNATIAWVMLRSDLWSELLRLQFLSFCGGCTVITVVGAPFLAIGGDHFLAWKALALVWGAVTHVAGFHVLERYVGRAAAVAWAVLFALPPVGLLDSSLMHWGNHQETNLLVLGALLLLAADRPLALGLLLGSMTWFCRTSAYGAGVVGLVALLRPGRLRLLGGVGLGLTLFLLPTSNGDASIYRFDESMVLPDGLDGVLERAAMLVDPDSFQWRLYTRMKGPAWRTVAVLAAGLAGLVLLLADARAGRRRLVLAALPLAFFLSFVAVGFRVQPTRDWSPIINVRYFTPWMMWLLVLAAAGAGTAVASGGPVRRVVGGLALAGMLAANVHALVARFAGARIDEVAFRYPATALRDFPVLAGARLTNESLDDAARPDVAAQLDRVRGERLGASVNRGERDVASALAAADTPAALRGLGYALAVATRRPVDALALLEGLAPERALELGRGMSIDLGLRLAREQRGTPPEVAVATALAGLRTPDCALCGVAGAPLARACSTQRATELGPTFAACLLQGAPPPETVRAAALLVANSDVDPARLSAIAAELDAADPALGAAFRDGAADPAAGLDERFDMARARLMARPPERPKPMGGGRKGKNKER